MVRLGRQTAGRSPPMQYALRKANPDPTSRSRLGVWIVGLPSAWIVSARWSSANRNRTFGRLGAGSSPAARGARPDQTTQTTRPTRPGARARRAGGIMGVASGESVGQEAMVRL